MKTIFTLLISLLFTSLIGEKAFSQNCNISAGGNGVSTALPAAITINGNMSDWAPYLNDPDNNSYDNTAGQDLDWPIADAGRDLTRFTFTEDANNLYIYLERAGSSNNTVDIIYYADINNNDIMESREPVVHINWSGASGNVSMSILEYVPALSLLQNSITANLDGSSLWGTLLYRNSLPQNGSGSVDGKSVELKIPFSQLTRKNALGGTIDQLSFGRDFKFHISTINGNVSSIPNANSINDNFGGCLKAPLTVLPMKLLNFDAQLKDSKVALNWATASETNVSHFMVERSTDGVNYSDAGMVFAFGNTSSKSEYNYTDNITGFQTPVVYYRLRSVDADGKTDYSATRIIRIAKQSDKNITILTYPNPVSNELRITIPANWQNKKLVYEVVMLNGQSVKKNENAKSSQTETLNVSNLAPGVYFVRVNCGGEVAQQKIIKQ